MRFLPHEPDQAWLLPPSVKDVLGADHLCFSVHRVVEAGANVLVCGTAVFESKDGVAAAIQGLLASCPPAKGTEE